MSILTPIFGFIKSQTGDNIGKTIGEDLPANWDKVETEINVNREQINSLVANKANKVQDNWIEATLENGWTGNLKYRRNQIGQLEISAKVTAGTAAANTVIATLPDGYRPSQYTPVDMFNITAGGMVNTPVFVHIDGRISLRSALVSGNLYHFMVVGV